MGRNRIYIRAEKFGLLALIPLYFIVVGLMIQPLSDIIPGLWRIIKEPDFLITDYFLVGGSERRLSMRVFLPWPPSEPSISWEWRWTAIRSHPAV